VSEPASISQGIAARYATAVFEIANESKAISDLEKGLDELSAALDESADLRELITSPVVTRAAQGEAISAIAKKMGLPAVLTNTLGLMAENRRLFVLPQLIDALRALIAADKGEVTADVISAKALTKTQADKLAKTLKARVGQDVKINATVDQSLVGGLWLEDDRYLDPLQAQLPSECNERGRINGYPSSRNLGDPERPNPEFWSGSRSGRGWSRSFRR